MSYDSDKTREVLEQVRSAMEDVRIKEALLLLRHADAAGSLRMQGGLVSEMKEILGDKHAAAVLTALAEDRCPFCTQGREPCEDCGGKGIYDETEVCKPCAGLGLRRCSFCNGTALAGYDFVPRGLRRAVMKARLTLAARQISALASMKGAAGARELAKRVLAVDRCRGILANAAEQVMKKEGATAGQKVMYSAGERAAIEKECRELNARAESLMRKLLEALAKQYAAKAERPGQDEDKRRLLAHRAKVFAKLSRDEEFGVSALRTPSALRES